MFFWNNFLKINTVFRIFETLSIQVCTKEKNVVFGNENLSF